MQTESFYLNKIDNEKSGTFLIRIWFLYFLIFLIKLVLNQYSLLQKMQTFELVLGLTCIVSEKELAERLGNVILYLASKS